MNHPPLPPLSPDVLGFSHVPEWKLRGACIRAIADGRADLNMWFPDGTSRRFHARIHAAQVICETCPIKGDCWEHREPFGLWGGRVTGTSSGWDAVDPCERVTTADLEDVFAGGDAA